MFDEYVGRLVRWFKVNIIIPFSKDVHNPRYVATTWAVGILCALLPIIGQTYVCIAIWFLFRRVKFLRFNLPISAALTFLSNPLTTPFLFYFYYLVGAFILGMSPFNFQLFIDRAKQIFENDPSLGLILKNSLTFVLSDVGFPVILGGAIFITIITPLVYILVYRQRKLNRRNCKI